MNCASSFVENAVLSRTSVVDLVDAHVHAWHLADAGHDWLADAGTRLFADFPPAQLEENLERAGAAAAVLIQSAVDFGENARLAAVAISSARILSFVGVVDPTGIARKQVESLAALPKVAGFRVSLRPDALSRITEVPPEVALSPFFELAGDLGLTIDLLVPREMLPLSLKLASRAGRAPVVINHAGQPPQGPGRKAWFGMMADLACQPNTHCKVSGLHADWVADPARVNDLIRQLLSIFSPARTLWGSNWPVILEDRPYSSWLEIALTVFESQLDNHDLDLVFGGVARGIYTPENPYVPISPARDPGL